MIRLRDDPDQLEAAVTRSGEQTGIPATQIRKDFWLTEILRACAAEVQSHHGSHLVFKGGTSLSKVFGLIERFSEDVDVLLISAGGKTAVDTVMKALADAAGAHVNLTGVLNTKLVETGQFRPTTFAYPNQPAGDNGVLLEVGSRGGALPNERHIVCSIVAPIAQDALGEPVAEAEPFEVDVLDPARTLVEKLVIIHEANLRPHGKPRNARIAKTVRHYYDVYCLLGSAQVVQSVTDQRASVLAREICRHSASISLPAVDYPRGGFAAAPAFQPKSSTTEAKAYRSNVAQLLWPGAVLPSFEECQARVLEYARIL